MLKEALEVFQVLLEREGESYVIDPYVPKDGTYCLIEMSENGNWKVKKTLEIFHDKKAGVIRGSKDPDYQTFRELDYYSKLLEMNKPLDPKKTFHSNQYLSFFIKKASIKSGKLTKEAIERFYELLKYTIKRMWEDQGEKIVYLKSMKLSKDKKGNTSLVPRSLKERYEALFDVEDLKKCKDAKEVLKDLFQAVDIKNFGATFAESGMNFSITGAVQFGQGMNKYEDTTPQEQNILSPFRDDTKTTDEKGEAKNSTLGTKIVSDEAHYFYPFVINPKAYKEYEQIGVTDGYTESDYETFKKAALSSVTAYATNAKEGCENEFAMFIETKEDLYLPNLTDYIRFEKGTEKDAIVLGFGDLLSEVMDRILSIEIHYNPYTTKLTGEIKNAKCFNIVTGKEV